MPPLPTTPCLQRLLTRTEQAIAALEAQNTTGGEPPAASLPRELANAEALRERVDAALARVAAAEGPRYTKDRPGRGAQDPHWLHHRLRWPRRWSPQIAPADAGAGGRLITAVDVTAAPTTIPI